ncbi:MAG: Hsp20/alpha crystallin family protein, partial [Chloroflexi bacterium]|nr:Hsp20/alpha crystallin family protein [Chloroflexota bacterium]
ETLESVSGREVLSHTEWKGGGMGISGRFRTRGILGDKEYHVGTMGKTTRRSTPKRTAEPPDVTEPPMDVFYDENQVTIVADVPGVSLEELELKVEKRVFFLATKGTALRSYRKELPLDVKVAPESLKATCNNGALEIRLQRLNEKGG